LHDNYALRENYKHFENFQPCVSSKLQKQSTFGDHVQISCGISYLYGNSCFAAISVRSGRLLRIPRYRFGIFFMSHVRPILAAFALFSHDTHAAVSRDPEFQVGFRERSSPPSIAIAGHLSYAQRRFFHNFLDLPLCYKFIRAFRALSTACMTMY